MNPQDVDTADLVDVKKAKEVCSKCYLSCMLLHGANNSRYYQLKVDLSNDMMQGTNNSPKTLVETMRILTNYVPPPRLQRAPNLDGKDWPLYKARAECCVVQRRTAPTRKSSAGTAADHTTRASAPSSSC